MWSSWTSSGDIFGAKGTGEKCLELPYAQVPPAPYTGPQHRVLVRRLVKLYPAPKGRPIVTGLLR